MKPAARETSSIPALGERLRQKERRLTGPRQAILLLLQKQDTPVSVKEIFKGLSGERCDLATVYRSMRILEKAGMVKRYDFGDGAARFALLAEGDDGHRHHLICTGCAEIVAVGECFPRELEKQIAARNGFRSVTHRLEFFGVCPECQRSQPRPAFASAR